MSKVLEPEVSKALQELVDVCRNERQLQLCIAALKRTIYAKRHIRSMLDKARKGNRARGTR